MSKDDLIEQQSTEIYTEESDFAALRAFLLDIDCLAPLNEWTDTFNLFDVLKIVRTEIRHSNMLSWLLTPYENHGLGDSILKGFIQYVVTNFYDENDPSIFSTLLMDCHDFVIQREWRNIDILATSSEHKFLLAIENKIDSSEHDDQLNRYKKILDTTYPGYKAMYIYPRAEMNQVILIIGAQWDIKMYLTLSNQKEQRRSCCQKWSFLLITTFKQLGEILWVMRI